MVSTTGDLANLGEPKSQRSRRVAAFDPETARLLNYWRTVVGEHGPLAGPQVCARKDGSIMVPKVLTPALNWILKGSRIRGVRFHVPRRTHTKVLLTPGAKFHVDSARRGYAGIQTAVDTHVHVIPAGVRRGSRRDGRWLAEVCSKQSVCRMACRMRK